MGEQIPVRRLYIINAEKCKCGCLQYTRQDTGCFVDRQDFDILAIPPIIVTRSLEEGELETQDFLYIPEAKKVPESVNAGLRGECTPGNNKLHYPVAYCHLRVPQYLMNPAIREALRRGQEEVLRPSCLDHVVKRATRETIKDAKRTGRIKPKYERHHSDSSGDLD